MFAHPLQRGFELPGKRLQPNHHGQLKGNIGDQNYDIPAGTDLSAYGSVVIWCEMFGVLFSPATLNPTS